MRWLYYNDANISIQIHGGYGSTGQFRVTLTNPYMGTIAATAGTTLFNEGTTITYNIPRASNSGQGRYFVGEYTLTVVDVIYLQEILHTHHYEIENVRPLKIKLI
jgi:hypothetical protein